MRHRKTEDTLYLLGGAMLGAAAMYLLDPDAGEKRRRQIAKATDAAYESARQGMASQLDRVTGQARDLAQHLTGHAADLQGSAADYAQGLADHAHSIASDLTDRATSYLHGGKKSVDRYGRQASKWGSRLFGKAQDAYGSARDTRPRLR